MQYWNDIIEVIINGMTIAWVEMTYKMQGNWRRWRGGEICCSTKVSKYAVDMEKAGDRENRKNLASKNVEAAKIE